MPLMKMVVCCREHMLRTYRTHNSKNQFSNKYVLIDFLADNKLLISMIACEPKTILALPEHLWPESSLLEDGGIKIIQTLSTLYDKQLSNIVDWAKEIPGTII